MNDKINIKKAKYFIAAIGKGVNDSNAVLYFFENINNNFELLKKEGNSTKNRMEHIIRIKKREFDILWSVADFKYEKIRYFYPIKKNMGEIDIYLGKLSNYARVEVEFKTKKEMRKFVPPEWFGPEISRWNYKIHKNIGRISFNDFKKRYSKKGISLKPIRSIN